MIKKIKEYLYNDKLDIRRRLYAMSTVMTLFILFVLSVEVLIFSRNMILFLAMAGVMILHIIIGVVTLKTKRLKVGAILSNILICFVYAFRGWNKDCLFRPGNTDYHCRLCAFLLFPGIHYAGQRCDVLRD